MAASLNKIMVIGNLGSDPDMRYTSSGTPVATFSLATNRSYRSSDGENRQETEWFTIVAWNRLAEQVNQYLTKGRLAYVEGRFRSRNWEGRDGQQRTTNEIIANSVVFLPQGGSPGAGDMEDGGVEGAIEPDDLPF